MRRRGSHGEDHRSDRAGWLRAAVLGSDDAIVSTASLMIGVAAASAPKQAILVAGISGLVAGAMSMAAGEYVSVSSQSDVAQADLAQERHELADDPHGEALELAAIYRHRGVPKDLAVQVADALMAHDALDAHARDELGLTESTRARPMQAAVSSALSFAVGAALPLLAVLFSSGTRGVAVLVVTSIIALVLLGVAAARIGGARAGRAALRVGLGGTMAIAVTAGVGQLFGAATG